PQFQFTMVYIGLLMAILLASLDGTIVSTALKAIIQDFGRQDLAAWLGSSYLLTAAPLGTLYGKLADIFGRKWTFVFAILVFEVGSVLCAVATSMEFLIAARAIAGIGGGGIFSLVLIIISDICSLRDAGKYQGAVGAVYGLASIIAPLVGGAFSDHISWRWCFWINLPMGAITVATVLLYLNFPRTEGSMREKIKRIDGIGAFILFITISFLAVPLQLAGSTWNWGDAQTIVCFVLFFVFLGIFIYVQRNISKEPIIPPSIFVNASVPALLAISIFLGAAFISGVYFISLYFQVVFGDTATQAGLATVPMVLGLVTTSIISGFLVSYLGNYKFLFFIGPFITAAGIALMAFLDSGSALWQQIVYLAVFGLGIGSMIQARVIGIQAAVPSEYIAVATAVAQTGNTLGGAVGIAITGTIFNNVIVSATQRF
ncbi:major facilitator superfamily domain-containing protein, partial [Chytriomyces sp. MP71]